jgi:phospholipid transport system substrate-binding protein
MTFRNVPQRHDTCPKHPVFSLSRRRLLMAGAAAAAVALSGVAGAAAATSAEEFVVRLGREVMRLAASDRGARALKQRFVRLLTRNADMKAIARFALGKYLRRMPKSMRAEYYRLVLDYIAGLFVYYRKDLAGRDIRVGRTTRRGRWLTVETELVYPDGRKAPVKWRVYKSGAGWKVGDVNIRGIWLSLRMREKFVSILDQNRGDFAALMDYLRRNAA